MKAQKYLKRSVYSLVFLVTAVVTIFLLVNSHVLGINETGVPDFSWFTQAGESNYQISSGDQLSALSLLSRGEGSFADGTSAAAQNFSGATIQVTANLDMTLYQSGTYQFQPISGFQGTFDGGDFTINNLLIDTRNTQYWNGTGLFDNLNNWSPTPTVQNLVIQNALVYGGADVGVIVGNASNVFIQNVRVSGTVIGSNSSGNIGGIAGQINGTNALGEPSIYNAIFYGSVVGEYNVGGIAGLANTAALSKVAAEANISIITGTFGQSIGGVVGQLRASTIVNAYFTGTVTGDSNAGGIVGQSMASSSINTAWAAGQVVGNISSASTTHAAGVAGIVGNAAGNTSVLNTVAMQTAVILNSSTATTGAARVLINNNSSGNIPTAGNSANLALATMTPGTVDFPKTPNYQLDPTQNGLDVCKTILTTDGTIEGRFANAPWVSANGSLPGFDSALDTPSYLGIPFLYSYMFNPIADVIYNGTAFEPTITVAPDYISRLTSLDFTIVSYNNNINAGVATITIAGTNNFTGTITITFNILKATPQLTTPTITAYEGQTLGDLSLPAGFEFNSPSNTLVGAPGLRTFSATYVPSDQNNYNVIPNTDVIIQVLARTIVPIPTINSTLLYYNGNQQSGVIFDGALNGVYFNITNFLGVEVGQYTTQFWLIDPISTVWSDGTTTPNSITWSIFDQVIIQDGYGVVVVNSNINFNDPLILTIDFDSMAGSDDLRPNYQSIIFEFSTDGNIWSTTIPTNVGTYWVRAVMSGSVAQTNSSGQLVMYNPYTTAAVSFTINPIDPIYTLPTNLVAIYGQTLASINLPSGFSFVLANTTLVGSVGANSFLVNYTPQNSSNYNTLTNLVVMITVTPQIVSMPQVVNNLVYNTFDQFGITNFNANSLGYILLSGDLHATLAGNYQAIFRLNSNFMWSDGSTDDLILNWAIAQAVPNTPALTDITVFEGQTLASITTQLGTGWTFDDSLSTVLTPVGTLFLNVTFNANDSNYVTVSSMVRVFVLARMVVQMPSVITGLVYNGSQQTGINFNQDDVDNGIISISNYQQTSSGSYLATILLVDNIGHVWSDGTNGTITIAWMISGAGDSYVDGYGELLMDQVFNFNDPLNPQIVNVIGDYTIMIVQFSIDGGNTWNNLVPVNAGTYFARIFLSGSQGVFNSVSGNYTFYNDFTSVPIMFVINPIEPTFMGSTTIYATYGQILSELTASLPIGISFTDPLSKRVGEVGEHAFVMVFIPTDTRNYKIITINFTIIVNPAITFRPTVINGLIYNGQAQIGINNWVCPIGSYFISAGSGPRTSAGTFSTTFSLERNFTWEDGTTTDLTIIWTIARATPDYVIPTNLTAYQGQTLDEINLPVGFSFVLSLNTLVGLPGNNSFDVIFTPIDSLNYNIISNLRITINVIAQIRVSLPVVIGNTLYFNSSAQQGILFDDSLLNVAFMISGTVFGTNIGTYTAVFILLDPIRYVWDDGTNESITLTFSISSVGNHFIDGNANVLINELINYLAPLNPGIQILVGDWQTIVFQFSSDGINWTNTAPVNVGSYWIRAILTNSLGTINPVDGSITYYNDFITTSLGFSIVPLDPEEPAIIVVISTYKDMLSSISLPANFTFNDSLTILVGNVSTITNPNLFAATYSPSNSNYNPILVWIHVVVNPLAIQIPTVNTGLIYNGLEINGIDFDDSLLNVAFSLIGDVSGTDVGNYTATFVLNSNYMWENGSTSNLILNWVISNAIGNATGVISDVVFGDGLTPSVNIILGDWPMVIFQYLVAGGWTNVAPTNVGNYQFRVLLTGSNNYADLLTNPISFNITPKSLVSLEVEAIADQIFTNSNITPTVLITDDLLGRELILNVDFTISYVNNLFVGVSTIIITGINNYMGQMTITFNITPAPSPIAPIVLTAVYGQTLADLNLPTGFIWDEAANPSLTTWVGNATAIGSYNTFLALEANPNPNFINSTITVNIWVARQSVVMPTTINGLVFNGANQLGITYNLSLLGVAYIILSGNTSETNQGTYTIIFSLDSNYMWENGAITDLELSFVIAQAQGDVVLTMPTTVVYQNDLIGTITVNVGDYDLNNIQYFYSIFGDTWITGLPNHLAVGTYFVKAIVSGSLNSNFADATTNIINVTVLPRDLNLDFNLNNNNLPTIVGTYSFTNRQVQPVIDFSNWLGFLNEGVDYLITISNNINVGQGVVTIIGMGNYTGMITLTFAINKAEGFAEITVEDSWFNAEPVTPVVTIIIGDWISSQISFSYSSDGGITWTSTAPTAAGLYHLIARFTGSTNYLDFETISIVFEIRRVSLTDQTEVGSLNPTVYNGQAQTPTIDLVGLVLDQDFMVTYFNNVNAGTATVIVTGINNFQDTITLTFAIQRASLTIQADANQSKIFGQADPVLTFSIINGTLFGNDVLSGLLGRVGGEEVGQFNFTLGSLANENYEITLVGTQTFSIINLPQISTNNNLWIQVVVGFLSGSVITAGVWFGIKRKR